MNKQLKRVSIVVLLMFLALFGSSTVIQFAEADNLAENPRNSRTLYASYDTERGSILVDGEAVAYSEPSGDDYKYQRVYPQGELYSAATGYFTIVQGSTQIEQSMNSYLSGTSNSQFFEQLNSIITGQNPQGASVELTLDADVQQAAYDALGDYSGAVVASDPKTGEILAFVSKESYDPNRLASHDTAEVDEEYQTLLDDPLDPLINRTIGGNLNPPGSTFKLVTAAAALESGDYTEDSTFKNPSSFTLPGTSTDIQNASRTTCGDGKTVTLQYALSMSCNIPFAELALEVGQEGVRSMAEALGFNDDSIEIPMGVEASVYPTVMSDDLFAQTAFGQYDVRATPLQMNQVSAAIANGGVLMTPTLIDKVRAPDLSVLQDPEPTVYSTPMSSITASTLSAMMVDGVSNGLASDARIDGVQVAGKTGTAENGLDENGDENPYTFWFTGFAPADDPQVAVTVLVENGGGQGTDGLSGKIASPIAKTVIEAVLNS